MIDNIAAIATPLSNAALGIIRVSGDSVISEISKIFSKDLSNCKGSTLVHGFIKNNDKVVDEVVLAIYLNPKSFTGEDLIEITTHGGILVMNEVLELILTLNIRLAEPGEFSKRAYLNQKIDLIQAEAIMDLINAESKIALDITRNGLLKKTSLLLDKPIKIILDLVTEMELYIDYPDYEPEEYLTKGRTAETIYAALQLLKEIISTSKKTYVLNKGISIAIVGKPNVGKSSLLNLLVGEQKAIVTDIAGTTRDAIEASIIYKNIKLNFIDTAGLRNTKNKIEKIGVEITQKHIKSADLIIVVLDNNSIISKDEETLIKSLKNRNYIIVANKIDLAAKLDKSLFDIHPISVKKNKGIDELKEKIISLVNINNNTNDLVGLFSLRQVSEIKKVYRDLNHILKTFDDSFFEEVAQGLRQVYENLLLITGKVYNQDIEKNIFKNFCLGK